MMHRICFVIVYIGKFPKYVNHFLNSCKYNPSIDWLIFTDNKIRHTPNNVKIVHFTLEDFRKKIKEIHNIEPNIKYGYKIAEFKPLYGDLFREYLTNYEFWGVADIDIIYGNIRKFMNEKLLSEYEVITTKNDFMAGHFTLYKNNTKINNLYRRSRDYKQIFEFERNLGFDEYGEIYKFKRGWIKNKPIHLESITHVIHKSPDIKFYNKNNVLHNIPYKLFWKKGKLYSWRKEYLYFHMIRYKNNKDFEMNSPLRLTYSIDKHGINPKIRFDDKIMKFCRNSYLKFDQTLGRIGIWLRKTNPKYYQMIKKLMD